MSHRVEPADLPDAAAVRGTTVFLLYPGESGSVRVNHVHAAVTAEDDEAKVLVTGFGRGVPGRVASGVTFSLLWPEPGPDGFSLIVDGEAALRESDTQLVLQVDGAVLHRPAPPAGESRC